MDLVKVAIFLAVFVLLLVIGRALAGASEVHASQLSVPSNIGPGTAGPMDGHEEQGRKPAVVGSEIGLPIPLPPLRQLNDGAYSRPKITNYFFLKTDLLTGPPDPNCLFDELNVEGRDPATDVPISYGFTVATPAGLVKTMDQEKLSSLYLENIPVVIVPRWDLQLILQTVIEEIVNGWGAPDLEEGEKDAQAGSAI
jgi:hypothetical protein